MHEFHNRERLHLNISTEYKSKRSQVANKVEKLGNELSVLVPF